MNRHAMRQLIVQTLYHIEVGVTEKEVAIASIEAFVLNLKEHAIDSPEIKLSEKILDDAFTIEAYYFTTLEGIIDNLEKIDKLIEEHLEGWALSRLNKVDKAILRLAVYEMTQELAPANVVINEAIELTKNFTDTGDKKSPNFNNRVLDNIGKTFEIGKKLAKK
ncbi:MAG: transcription antitermination factor NusB [Turicibacter sp.]|nr:transcription antitermination factor NusB [Turicibacter sp.]